jgi:bifunctional non-homologous end joining protein LigD
MKKSVSLRFTQGSSDKVYNAELVPDGQLWVVNFSYGKYGATLRAGTKTKVGIPYERALKIYQKIVAEKMSKGYSPEGEGVAFVGTDNAGRVTGFLPQLLNTVSEDDVLALIGAEAGVWAGEEKHDGERRSIKVTDGKIVSSNRKGLCVPTKETIVAAVEKLSSRVSHFEVDGEDMGGHFIIFDILMFDGQDLRALPLSARIEHRNTLEAVLTEVGVNDVFRVTETTPDLTPALAADLIRTHRMRNSEGVVFKRQDAPYTVGKPSSGGTQLKLKFTQDATVRVSGHNEGVRSVGMEVLDGENWVGVGNVTIPVNHKIPDVGSLVDVKYLYAYPKGSLFQPQYLGPRDDVDASDCAIEKLVYKRMESA